MISQKQVIELYARANPVPDVESLTTDDLAASYLEALESRSSEMTQVHSRKMSEEEGPNLRRRRPVVPWLVGAVVVGLMAWGLVFINQNDQSPVADGASVIVAYEKAYNSGDIDGVMALFADDAVIKNHPMNYYAEGVDQIRDLQIEDMSSAISENAYTFSNIETNGDIVSWDHSWVSREGIKSCRIGNEAVIEDGKIAYWTWPEPGLTCP